MTKQRPIITAVLTLGAVSLLTLGCEKKEVDPATKQAEARAAPADTVTPRKDSTNTVDVPQNGKQFDPPVKPEQIPMGAWMCDMGTVHYASMSKGDGKCPVCKMELKHKMAGGHGEMHEGHEGHEGHEM